MRRTAAWWGGLFNTLVNVTFVLTANTIGKKVADVGLF